MASPDILFKGIPRGPTRGYTARVIEATQPERVVIPCCGSFSLAQVAREAGVAAEQIVCGDISLYSTALGNAIMGRDWRLEIKHDSGEIVRPYLTDPISKAAAVLFMIRVRQYDAKKQSIHKRDQQRELLLNVGFYMDQLKAEVSELAESLHGLTYHLRDMWETLEAHRQEPATILLVNPPRYTGGYNRMFKGIEHMFDWDEPAIAQFVEKDYERLMALLGQSEAQTLMYYATPGEDPTPLWGEPWRTVFADRPSDSKRVSINWIISNRAELEPMASRPRIVEGQAKYALFEGEVRPDSELRAVGVEKAVGNYYRDLFIHRLEGSLAEQYVALLLDGQLMAVVGMNLKNLRTGGGKQSGVTHEPAHLTFAFTVPHAQYKRLHKLTLMFIVSREFWQDVLSKQKNAELFGNVREVQTTMLTRHPENKTARGILKLINREPQPDGSYKLAYKAEVTDRTRQETVALWLKRFGTLAK